MGMVGGLVVDGHPTWLSGDWYGGTWDSRNIKDNLTLLRLIAAYQMIHILTWINGRWYDGIWNNGTWNDGRWYDTWNNENIRVPGIMVVGTMDNFQEEYG
jgi:hypothetical protein